MSLFTNGVLTMAFWTATLLFLRFYRRTHDRLFVMFAVSFFIMGVNRCYQTMLRASGAAEEERMTLVYVIRLAAFLIILVAIIDKNRAARPVREPGRRVRTGVQG